jgi:hypothetical protein
MRTLGHCQDHDLSLYVGCGACRAGHMTPARAQCPAMRAFTVEELARSGWFVCPSCGHPGVGVSVYRDGYHRRQLECWTPTAQGLCHRVTEEEKAVRPARGAGRACHVAGSRPLQ